MYNYKKFIQDQARKLIEETVDFEKEHFTEYSLKEYVITTLQDEFDYTDPSRWYAKSDSEALRYLDENWDEVAYAYDWIVEEWDRMKDFEGVLKEGPRSIDTAIRYVYASGSPELSEVIDEYVKYLN